MIRWKGSGIRPPTEGNTTYEYPLSTPYIHKISGNFFFALESGLPDFWKIRSTRLLDPQISTWGPKEKLKERKRARTVQAGYPNIGNYCTRLSHRQKISNDGQKVSDMSEQTK